VASANSGKNQQKKLRRLARPQGSAAKTRFFAKNFDRLRRST
jgi:hypothetical protein